MARKAVPEPVTGKQQMRISSFFSPKPTQVDAQSSSIPKASVSSPPPTQPDPLSARSISTPAPVNAVSTLTPGSSSTAVGSSERKKAVRPAAQTKKPVAPAAKQSSKKRRRNLIDSDDEEEEEYEEEEQDDSDEDYVATAKRNGKGADNDDDDEDDSDVEMVPSPVASASEADDNANEEEVDEADIAPKKKKAKLAGSSSTAKIVQGSLRTGSVQSQRTIFNPTSAMSKSSTKKQQSYTKDQLRSSVMNIDLSTVQNDPIFMAHQLSEEELSAVPGLRFDLKEFPEKLTPLEKLVVDTKRMPEFADTVLFVESGYRFRFFGKDALIASKELSIFMHLDKNFQTGSIPVQRLEVHLRRLCNLGYKCATLAQTETRALKKDSGLFKREITGIYTKATLIQLGLDEAEDCPIMLLSKSRVLVYSLLTRRVVEADLTEYEALRERYVPGEILISPDCPLINKVYIAGPIGIHMEILPDLQRNPEDPLKSLRKYLVQFGLDALLDKPSGAVVTNNSQHNSSTGRGDFVLDGLAVANMQVHEFLSRKVLPRACSAMGKRRVKDWFLFPLTSPQRIEERLNTVAETIAKLEKGSDYISVRQKLLKKCGDLDRLLTKCMVRKCQHPDFVAFLSTLESFDFDLSLLKHLRSRIHDDQRAAAAPLDAAIKSTEELLDAELASMRSQLKLPRLQFVSWLQTEYLVEVDRACVPRVPKSWIQVNSTKAVVRFHTTAVLKLVDELQANRDRREMAMQAAWLQWLGTFCKSESFFLIQDFVSALATEDATYALASLCVADQYVRPSLLPQDDERRLSIVGGRHPLLERDSVIPNDLSMQKGSEIVITGPNLGGKSTTLRMVAWTILLAHVGCFVPCTSCSFGTFDGIYMRMGASDDLAKGRSTFFTELYEASQMISTATDRSLVVFDELGRGTSTHDGMAIAWAVAEYMKNEKKCCTLFVTHFSLLTSVEGVENYHMGFSGEKSENEGRDENITLLYTLVPGRALRSYGLNVATRAGIPVEVVQRAATYSRAMETMTQLQQLQAVWRHRDDVDAVMQAVAVFV
jgi:DNA mismatch repair ATPase MutS